MVFMATKAGLVSRFNKEAKVDSAHGMYAHCLRCDRWVNVEELSLEDKQDLSQSGGNFTPTVKNVCPEGIDSFFLFLQNLRGKMV